MIYLDYQATTPLAPEAREAMLRWLGGPESDTFGNPHSPHRMGRMAAAAVEAAREQVAALMPSGGRTLFTSGATEALNMVLRACREGVVRTVEGQDLALEFDSICLHSDTPGALDLVEATRAALDAAGIEVRTPR